MPNGRSPRARESFDNLNAAIEEMCAALDEGIAVQRELRNNGKNGRADT